MKQTVELFCGTKSFSKVMESAGHKTFTVDFDSRFEPTIVRDITKMNRSELPKKIDILWASPSCTCFSVASMGHHWGGGWRKYEPKTQDAKDAIKLMKKTILLIKESGAKIWFIENPRGVLRKLPLMNEIVRMGGVRRTVTYCQYGDTRMKPTDIWTNALWWNPKNMCKNGSPCHEAAPRGARTGTQGLKGAMDRGRIPSALFTEILAQMPRK